MLTSFSIVGGPSFNRARFRDGFVRTSVASIDADNSLGDPARASASPTRCGRAWPWSVSAGIMFNRPGVVYRDSSGTEFRDQWKADAVVLSAGVVYSVF